MSRRETWQRDSKRARRWIEARKGAPARAPAAAPPRKTDCPGVAVLFIGETAARLHMPREQLETMIAAGTVETLPTQFMRVIPTIEVERLQRARS